MNQKVGTHYKKPGEQQRNDQPLQWKDHRIFETQHVRAKIRSAVHRSGRMLYSWSIERIPPKPDMRPSGHFRPDDSEEVISCINKVMEYLKNPNHDG